MKRAAWKAAFATAVFVWMLVLFCGGCFAATLHSILVCYTGEPGRPDREQTYRMLDEEASLVARQAGLEHRRHHFAGRDFNCSTVARFLRNFRCRPEDTVLFVYDGHGYNAQDSQWPYLSFLDNDKDLPFQAVVDSLRRAGPRLLVALSGACNSIPPPNAPKTNYTARSPQGNPVRDRYEELFVGSAGEVVGTASKPGQYSFGNVYPVAFVKSLNEVCRQRAGEARWADVMERTRRYGLESTSSEQHRRQGGPQYAIHEISLKDRVAEDDPAAPEIPPEWREKEKAPPSPAGESDVQWVDPGDWDEDLPAGSDW